MFIIREEKYQEIKPGKKRIKTWLAGIILILLGKALGVVSSLDKRVQQEISDWYDTTIISMKIGINGPSMSVEKRNGRLVYLGSKDVPADLGVYFKNIEAALPALTGSMSIAQSFAEHRVGMKGDIALGMSLVRCLYIVESYLFPRFITKKIMQKVPEKIVSSFKIYTTVILG